MAATTQLDIRTILCLISISSLTMGIGMFVAAKSYPDYVRGIQRWGCACLAHSFAWLFISQHDTLPLWLSVVSANTLIVWALVANYHSIREFLGDKEMPFHLHLFVGATAASQIFSTYISPSLNARTLVMSIISAVLMIGMGNLLARSRHDEDWQEQSTYRGMMFGFWGCGAILVGRVFYTLFFPASSNNVLNSDGVQGLYFVAVFIQIMLFTVGFLLLCNERINSSLRRLASYDPLTEVYNRGTVEALACHAIEAARRARSPLCVLLCDIDHFKAINDTLGHEGGDRALQLVVATLKTQLRGGDVLGRYGGEEFLVIASNTAMAGAFILAERLRIAIETTPLPTNNGSYTMTMSIGVSQLATKGDTCPDIIRRADEALYQAKDSGRNRVVLAPL